MPPFTLLALRRYLYAALPDLAAPEAALPEPALPEVRIPIS